MQRFLDRWFLNPDTGQTQMALLGLASVIVVSMLLSATALSLASFLAGALTVLIMSIWRHISKQSMTAILGILDARRIENYDGEPPQSGASPTGPVLTLQKPRPVGGPGFPGYVVDRVSTGLSDDVELDSLLEQRSTEDPVLNGKADGGSGDKPADESSGQASP